MPDVYTKKDSDIVRLLVRRVFKKKSESGITYRQIAALLKAQPSTVHRWFHGQSMPSRHHVVHMKKFMGYIA